MAPTYFSHRMNQLGIDPETATVQLLRYNQDTSQNELQPVPVFREHPKGIEIVPYTLDRSTIRIEKEGSRMKRDWSIIRLEKPVEKQNGDVMKYQMPKGHGSVPLICPSILDAYDAETPIQDLFLTEGFFKAWKGYMHGLHIIGLPSITHMKDKEKGGLHPDILRIIKTCKVQRVVWLTDGDCLDITRKEITDKKDLYIRPANFYNSVETFKRLLDDYECDKYFMHVNTDKIMEANKGIDRDALKGLDDIMIALPDQIPAIIEDLHSVSGNGRYFEKFNITTRIGNVRDYFRLDNVTRFYLFHKERRHELAEKEFKFHGTVYQYSVDDNECKVRIPGESKLYFRVGDDYYKHVKIPNKYSQQESSFKGRRKGTIIDDHGKDFVKHIPKFEAFCNVPNNVNFQPIIHNCFNVYNPMEHMPDEEPCTAEDCPTIIGFIHHIFGDRTVQFIHPKSKERHEYKNFDLALDYLQILYQQPAEKLPILCLVSKENNTGKSTFGFLLQRIFGSNVAIVGNQDLAGDFNAHWATKLVVICDETKIDKQHVVEKVKSLSTANKVTMNAKGKDHVEIDCFIKFIFITNNEENFIYMSDEDIRYWIIKVPQIKDENPGIVQNFVEEIPAFLSYLNHRKLQTEKLNRMWFHPSLIRTDAMKKVIQFSRSTVEKEIRQRIRDMFFDFGGQEIHMSRTDIHETFFRGKYEANYIEKVLKDDMKIEQYHILVDDVKKTTTKRYSFPRWEELFKEGKKVLDRVEVERTGRPYVFRRSEFITPEEDARHLAAEGTEYTNNLLHPEATGTNDELPF